MRRRRLDDRSHAVLDEALRLRIAATLGDAEVMADALRRLARLCATFPRLEQTHAA